MFQKVLSYDLLAKIDFIAFSVRFGDTILRNNGLQIFLTLSDLLLHGNSKPLIDLNFKTLPQ